MSVTHKIDRNMRKDRVCTVNPCYLILVRVVPMVLYSCF